MVYIKSSDTYIDEGWSGCGQRGASEGHSVVKDEVDEIVSIRKSSCPRMWIFATCDNVDRALAIDLVRISALPFIIFPFFYPTTNLSLL
jgi:hypothetical protein